MTTTAKIEKRMSDRDRLICEVSEYFNDHGSFAVIYEGNVDEMYQAMVEEKAEFERLFQKERLQRIADNAVDNHIAHTAAQDFDNRINAGVSTEPEYELADMEF